MKVITINESLFEDYLNKNNLANRKIVRNGGAFIEENNHPQSIVINHKDIINYVNNDDSIVTPKVNKTIPIVFYNLSLKKSILKLEAISFLGKLSIR
ncbi:hypothetical protein [Citrobacter meridianamericanus]|uniref:Uncharacterized protein n=1 Tax=Citrobacter meridianamericanus TaxID=2894201 RepID=A0ABT1B689_9ENTR|nr:hypothetical protein [Citrobacter meridianamericanus]MCO5781372.1 hypothetical protein [Citrobacter meridianamericanus]